VCIRVKLPPALIGTSAGFLGFGDYLVWTLFRIWMDRQKGQDKINWFGVLVCPQSIQP
jgi:hypothetical protein